MSSFTLVQRKLHPFIMAGELYTKADCQEAEHRLVFQSPNFEISDVNDFVCGDTIYLRRK